MSETNRLGHTQRTLLTLGMLVFTLALSDSASATRDGSFQGIGTAPATIGAVDELMDGCEETFTPSTAEAAPTFVLARAGKPGPIVKKAPRCLKRRWVCVKRCRFPPRGVERCCKKKKKCVKWST